MRKETFSLSNSGWLLKRTPCARAVLAYIQLAPRGHRNYFRTDLKITFNSYLILQGIVQISKINKNAKHTVVNSQKSTKNQHISVFGRDHLRRTHVAADSKALASICCSPRPLLSLSRRTRPEERFLTKRRTFLGAVSI